MTKINFSVLTEFIMNYNFVERSVRGTGRTTVLMDAVKKIGGKLVVMESSQMRGLPRKNFMLLGSHDVLGCTTPLILDNYVISSIFESIGPALAEAEHKLRLAKLYNGIEHKFVQFMLTQPKRRAIRQFIKTMKRDYF